MAGRAGFFLLWALGPLLLAPPAGAQAGPPCATPRPLSAEENAFLAEARRALSDLLPAAPPGWVRQGAVESATRGPLCDDPGYKPPLFARVAASYLPTGAPELSAETRERESARYQAALAAAVREEAEAAKSGDKARIERARKALRDLRARPYPTPPVVPPTSPRRLDARFTVNPSSLAECARSSPLEIEGAAIAFRATATTCRGKLAADVFAVAFGGWRAQKTAGGLYRAAFNEWPASPLERARAHTASAEIWGDPEAVDAAVRSFDPAKLRGFMAPR
ncbi:MAG TPA: hypothetical protein VIW03_08260 [Anaeromyxobacter sp.]